MIDADGFVAAYLLRQRDQKRAAVNALQEPELPGLAAGDSFNDTAMLGAADAGFFIHPPEAIAAQFPQFPVASDYRELMVAIDEAAGRLAA